MHDLLISGAVVVDGTGAKATTADVAVSGGKIAAVGQGLGPAKERIDAGGLALMPGVIDGHTHYDAQITWDPWVDPSPWLGVTTVVIGNCGFTIAPCKPEDRDLTMRNLTHVEGMSLEALRAGIKWGFEDVPGYLSMLETQGVGPNVAAFVGHSSIRTFVLGPDAPKRAATTAEIERMADIVRRAMKAGAVGFATSTNEPHNGEGGIPMPSRLADDAEMTALARALGESKRGVLMLTKGSATPIARIERWAAAAGRPTIVAAMLWNSTNPSRILGFLDDMAAARSRGHRLVPQVSCCPLSMDFTLESAYPFEGIGAWKPAMEAHGGDSLRKVFRDPAFRGAVKGDLEKLRGHRLFNSEWDKVFVVEVAKTSNRALEGKTVDELARGAGKHPLDWLLDFGLDEDLKTLFVAQLLNSDETAVGALIANPEHHVALSDAGAHLTFFCDAGYGLHLLGHWVRDRGVLTLEAAVHKLSGHPASLFGLKDRGRIAPGYAADLMLFDPKTVGRAPKQRVFDLPAKAPRLTTAGIGVHGVWINGTRVADAKGRIAGVAPTGRVIRDFAA